MIFAKRPGMIDFILGLHDALSWDAAFHEPFRHGVYSLGARLESVDDLVDSPMLAVIDRATRA